MTAERTDAEFIVGVLKTFGIPAGWIILIVVIFIIFLNPEKTFIWVSKIQYLFAWASSNIEKKAISNDVRGNILKVSKKIAKDNPEILPFDLKIEWVKEEDPETFINEGQVIVRMNSSKNPCKNYVTAVGEYVRNGMIPYARSYIDREVLEATDLSIIRKLLCMSWEESVTYFDSSIYNRMRDENPNLKELLNDIILIDNNGMFIPILLNEYGKIGRRIYPGEPDDCLVAESREFLRFLKNIADREAGELTELIFNRDYFKIAVSLAANSITYKKRGLAPYKNTIKKALDEGVESVYIFGLGTKKFIAEQIAELMQFEDLRIKDAVYHYYTHKSKLGKKDGVCVEIKIWTDSDIEIL